MASTHWSPTAPSPRRPDKLRRLQTLPDVPRARGSLRTPRCVSLGLCLLSASHPLGLLEESVLGKRGRPRFVTVCLPYPSWSVTPPPPKAAASFRCLDVTVHGTVTVYYVNSGPALHEQVFCRCSGFLRDPSQVDPRCGGGVRSGSSVPLLSPCDPTWPDRWNVKTNVITQRRNTDEAA